MPFTHHHRPGRFLPVPDLHADPHPAAPAGKRTSQGIWNICNSDSCCTLSLFSFILFLLSFTGYRHITAVCLMWKVVPVHPGKSPKISSPVFYCRCVAHGLRCWTWWCGVSPVICGCCSSVLMPKRLLLKMKTFSSQRSHPPPPPPSSSSSSSSLAPLFPLISSVSPPTHKKMSQLSAHIQTSYSSQSREKKQSLQPVRSHTPWPANRAPPCRSLFTLIPPETPTHVLHRLESRSLHIPLQSGIAQSWYVSPVCIEEDNQTLLLESGMGTKQPGEFLCSSRQL